MLAQELRQILSDKEAVIREIEQEIVDGFTQYCESGAMEEWLKEKAFDTKAVVHSRLKINVDYMPAVDENWSVGYRCGGYIWINPEGGRVRAYRGITLSAITQIVNSGLYGALETYMVAQGFSKSDLEYGEANKDVCALKCMFVRLDR